jgi:gluconolactonase
MPLELIEFAPEGSRIFSKQAEMEKLVTGYHFTEGPVWDSKQDCLFFTDFQDNLIYRWSPAAGALVYRENGN